MLLPARVGEGPTRGGARRSYTTRNPLVDESVLSEGGIWVNNGLDWTNVTVASGLIFGTQAGGGFDDSYAQLSGRGSWSPAQEIVATVFKGTTSGIQEVELCFRGSDAAHFSICYEINFAHDGQYVDFVRWPGPLGTQTSDFTFLVPSQTFSIAGGVTNGSIIRGRMVGDTLTAWIDKGSGFQLIGSATDTSNSGHAALSAGVPRVGFFKTSGSGNMNQYGFTQVIASEL